MEANTSDVASPTTPKSGFACT